MLFEINGGQKLLVNNYETSDSYDQTLTLIEQNFVYHNNYIGSAIFVLFC